ncbi:Hypothetical protein NTJ_15579 [Nesidiocoris tenuis]|uniref:ARF7 effector protein C-terminal domain-containing protein n=1 Tax=Nesidiocoris tenuis TaxID=355587 RepID=A0ABN7BEG1_9HEMI|nr:Hypothetical protein NTJ_15579 [Nesidiocoris tenuis]
MDKNEREKNNDTQARENDYSIKVAEGIAAAAMSARDYLQGKNCRNSSCKNCSDGCISPQNTNCCARRTEWCTNRHNTPAVAPQL